MPYICIYIFIFLSMEFFLLWEFLPPFLPWLHLHYLHHLVAFEIRSLLILYHEIIENCSDSFLPMRVHAIRIVVNSMLLKENWCFLVGFQNNYHLARSLPLRINNYTNKINQNKCLLETHILASSKKWELLVVGRDAPLAHL